MMASVSLPARLADVDPRWQTPLLRLSGVIALLLLLFHRDAGDMASIWWNSSTYGHCLFILPIVAWLFWQRRQEVATITPAPWAWGLVPFAVGAFAWVLGEAAAVSFIRHAGLVFMIQSAVLACLGPAVTRALLFPVFYLSFLVPFGEEMVPPMQTLTAKMCMVLLGWVGIPAHIDGIFITISSGLFKVAEACSGVKFLVAMIAYAVLAANVCFRSWTRRIAFLAFAIAVPVLANGLRAFGTIYISHLTDISFAASFDHVIYGWVFFGLVMLLVMGAAWPFFDRTVNDPWTDGQTPDWARVRSRPRAVLAGLCGILAAVMLWLFLILPLGQQPVPNAISLPDVPGWTRVQTQSRFPWAARFDGADHSLSGSYTRPGHGVVELSVALYGWQGEGREIVGFGQGAYDPDSEWAWSENRRAPANGKAERLIAPGRIARETVTFYVLGNTVTGAARTVKLATLRARLLGGDQSAVAMIVSAEENVGHDARKDIDAFLSALGPVDRQAGLAVKAARGS